MLLENFAPGVMDKLGVGAAVLMAENPRLIYASATGYGLSGPERDNLAMDITIQAASGAISVTGFADGPPVKAGPAIADFLSGTHLYGAIVTALYERERTGRGRLVEVAMIETMFPTLASNLGMIHNNPGAAARAHRQPPRRPLGLALQRLRLQGRLVRDHLHQRRALAQPRSRAMGRDDLADDPRFATNAARVEHMDETDAVVEAWAAGLTRAEIFAATGAAPGAVGAGARSLRGAGQRAHARPRHAGDRSTTRSLAGSPCPAARCATTARRRRRRRPARRSAPTTPRSTASCWGWAPRGRGAAQDGVI